MSPEEAESIAVAALVFIASDAKRLARFLDMTGLQPESIREAASTPGFLAGVLRHVVGWEPDLLAFAHDADLRPQDVQAAAVAIGAMEAG